jgi:hypothetical protein
MQFSIAHLTHPQSLNPQIKLKLINTFFSLTTATYFVSVHHTPKMFYWSFTSNELKQERLADCFVAYSPRNDAPTPSSRALAEGESIQKLKFINDCSTFWWLDAPKLDERQSDNTEKKVQLEGPLLLLSIRPSLSFPPFHGESGLTPNGEPPKNNLFSNAMSIKVDEDFRQSYIMSDGLEKPNFVPKSLHLTYSLALPLSPDQSKIFEKEARYSLFNLDKSFSINNSNVTLSSHIYEAKRITKFLRPPSPSIPPSTLSIESQSRVSLQQNEEVIPIDASLPHFSLRNKIGIPGVEIPLQVVEQVQVTLREEPVEIAPPSPTPLAKNNTLQPWNTYIVSSNNPLLRFWLMKLAPESNIDPEEIPFRKALVETLLSPEFQSYVTLDWEEEDVDDQLRHRRANFCTTYMEKLDWSATRFERLFHTESRDWHQVNEDAYVFAYNFPLRLGVHAYRDEDFPEHH